MAVVASVLGVIVVVAVMVGLDRSPLGGERATDRRLAGRPRGDPPKRGRGFFR